MGRKKSSAAAEGGRGEEGSDSDSDFGDDFRAVLNLFKGGGRRLKAVASSGKRGVGRFFRKVRTTVPGKGGSAAAAAAYKEAEEKARAEEKMRKREEEDEDDDDDEVDFDAAAVDAARDARLGAVPQSYVSSAGSVGEQEPAQHKERVVFDHTEWQRQQSVVDEVAVADAEAESVAAGLSHELEIDRRNDRRVEEVFPDRVVPQEEKHPFHHNQRIVYTLAVEAIMLKGAQERREVRRRESAAAASADEAGAEPAGPAAAADRARLAALELVAEAFHVSEREYQDTMEAYSGESGHDILKRELLMQLGYVCNDPYYNADAFGGANIYEAWLAREKRDIRNALVDLLSPPLPEYTPPADVRARKLVASASVGGQGKGDSGSKEKKKKKGGLGGCLASLCGGGGGGGGGPSDDSGEPPLPSSGEDARHRKLREQYEAEVRRVRAEREAVRARVEPECAAAERLEQEEPLDYNEAHTALMRVLLQYEQDPDLDRGPPSVLVRRPGLRLRPLLPLSPTALDVLGRFGLLFRVGRVRQLLDYFSMLLYNLSNEADYFTQLSDTAFALDKLRKRNRELTDAKGGGGEEAAAAAIDSSDERFEPWTRDELAKYEELMEEAFSWCRDCLGRYQTVFYRKFDALGECVAVMSEVQDVLAELREARGEEPGDLTREVTVAVREAQTLQYRELVSISSTTLKGIERARGHVPDQAESLDDSAPGGGGAPKRMITFNVLGKILDINQLLAVFGSVGDELKADEYMEEAFMDVPDFSLAAVAADNYLTLLWSDAQLFLRNESSKLEGGAPFSVRVFRAYDAMRAYYALASTMTDLPSFRLQNWFEPFVDRWLSSKREKFTHEYLDGLIRSEEWRIMTERVHYSTSVVDLFRLMTPISTAFKRMPYTPEHISEFARLVTSAVSNYVERVAASLRADVIDREDRHPASWGYAMGPDGEMVVSIDASVTVRLNDMYTCKLQLGELLKVVDLERAFETKPQLGSRGLDGGGGAAAAAAAAAAAGGAAAEAEADGPEQDAAESEREAILGCHEGFQHIRRVFEGSADALARGYGGVCARMIHVALWHEPEREVDMYDALEPVWDYLMSQLDFLTDINTGDDASSPDLLDPVFYQLAQMLLSRLVCAFEQELVNPRKGSHKNHLAPSQYRRVTEGADLCLEFFSKVYGMPSYYLDIARVGPLQRVHTIVRLLGKPTAELAALYDTLEPAARAPDRKSWNEERWEAHRQAELPYVTAHQLFSLLKHRAHTRPDDRAAHDFVHDRDRSLLGRFRRIF